ncbi:MAG: glycosyltransferase family 4 protein [Verrucomicrobiota bacterium]
MVAHSYYPNDPRVRREAEAMVRQGHRVEVICLRRANQASVESVAGVDVFRLAVERKRGSALRYIFEYCAFFILAFARLSARSLKQKYSVVVVHNMPNFLVYVSLLARARGARVVLDIHDPMPEIYMDHHSVGARHLCVYLLRLEERIGCLGAQYLMTVNEPMRERLVQHGLSRKHVAVLLNLPDERIFPPSASRSSPCGADHPFTLIYTGTVSSRYGLDLAIRGVKSLVRSIPSIRMLIVGDGPDRPRLKVLAQEAGVGDRVVFRDFLPLEEVPALLSECQVGISTHPDGSFWDLYFSTKVVEYMRVGLSVVSSRTRGIVHYFDDSAIFYYRPGDMEDFCRQVKLVYGRQDLVAARADSVRKRLQTLSWDIEQTKIENFLRYWTSNTA